jgi:adenylate cyclase
LKVSHILEGSVRKSGSRLRITAQLIDGATGEHAWAERYDRDLSDIFALQDEISEAIVKALRLKLLPEEKKAIERRGTTNAEAYNLYLMARQNYVIGNEGYSNRAEAIVRLCRRATEIDPNYAQGWALMALGQMILYFTHGVKVDDGLKAVERALTLDANLAEAHAIKARILSDQGRTDEASAEIAQALRLDAESYEVNKSAARLSFRQRAVEDAARYFEKATALMETDFNSPLMLMTCYRAQGNSNDMLRVARIALSRAEKTLSQDQNNGAAVASGADALAALGEKERASDWITRALLIDPDNMNMRYNFACTLVTQLRDFDAALAMLGPVFARWNVGFLKHAQVDPDLDAIRDDPRFKAMLAAAEVRVAAKDGGS